MTHDLSTPASRRFERWGAPLALVVLAVLTVGNVIPNLFIRDDIGIILGNPLIRSWSGMWHAFGAAYWPPANSGELYRPLTIAWVTLQWQLGGGHEFLFRLVTVALYAVTALAVWGLLRRLAPPAAAWAGAAIFAVHPVHVEAAVEAVSQSEMFVTALLCWAVALHIDANAGRGETRRVSSAESLLFAVALFVKENALVLPALLIAADLLVTTDGDGFRARWRRWRAHYGAMVVIAAVFWVTRGVVLGAASGTAPQEALTGGLIGRTFTMAGVPAEWLRLFLWPAHLQDEWSLLEWTPTVAWSLRETLGVVALGSLALATVLAWRPRPHLAFALVWMAIALGPVANILIPTGVIIAERTLFLPSVGVAIAVAALIAPYARGFGQRSTPRERLGLALFAVVLALGMIRSALRCVDWRTPVIWAVRSLELAPISWRTHLTYATTLIAAGDTTDARDEVRASIRLRPDNPVVVKTIADNGRRTGGACASSVVIYEELLAVAPGRSDARASLVACYAVMGRYADAEKAAHAGLLLGLNADFYRVVEKRAEQSIRAHTPVGHWRVYFGNGSATDIGGPLGHP